MFNLNKNYQLILWYVVVSGSVLLFHSACPAARMLYTNVLHVIMYSDDIDVYEYSSFDIH